MKLTVATRWEAARWASAYDTVVSVFSPAHLLRFSHPNHLTVEFADRTNYQEGAPKYEDIATILDYTARRQGGSFLVHCKAGQSRSTAVAIAICAQSGMSEYEAWEFVYHHGRPKSKVGERPFIPNPRVLQHADVYLGTKLLHLSNRAGEIGRSAPKPYRVGA